MPRYDGWIQMTTLDWVGLALIVILIAAILYFSFRYIIRKGEEADKRALELARAEGRAEAESNRNNK